jgi:hypothetical protein
MIDFTFFGTFFCRISDWSDEENLMQYWIVIVRIGLDIVLISFGYLTLADEDRIEWYRNGFGQEGIVTSNPKRPPTSGVVSNISMQ